MLYCRLIYMLSILCVRLTMKIKVGIPVSFKVGWYPPKKTVSSHLKQEMNIRYQLLRKAKRANWEIDILPTNVQETKLMI